MAEHLSDDALEERAGDALALLRQHTTASLDLDPTQVVQTPVYLSVEKDGLDLFIDSLKGLTRADVTGLLAVAIENESGDTNEFNALAAADWRNMQILLQRVLAEMPR